MSGLAWVVGWLGLAPAALSGCLVTDEITFEEEADLPTVIVDAPGTKTPIGSIVWLDSETQSSWPFPVRVRDENLGQPLTAHYRVVTAENEFPTFVPVELKPSGAELRDLTLTVKSESLRVGECHRLELAVSAYFLGGTRPVFFNEVLPGREGEVAHASWLLWEGPGDMLATDLARLAQSCVTIEDLLAPALVEAAP